MKKQLLFAVATTLLFNTMCFSQDDDNSVTSTKIKDGIHVIQGRGGNIGLSIGADGAFMIDDKFAPMADNIRFPHSMSFHLNGQKLDHMMVGSGNAHTDGDSVVFFSPANVVHTGDIYFNGFYPLIDPDSGGSVTGTIEAVDAILAKIDDDTIVIPGHGAVSNKAELIAYRNILSTVAETIGSLKAEGKSDDEIFATKPTADFNEAWGNGFINPETWVN